MSHRVSVKYYGKATHASAYPWEGVNALDAAVLAYNNLSALRQQLKPEWRLHGEEQIETWFAAEPFQNKSIYFQSILSALEKFKFILNNRAKSIW